MNDKLKTALLQLNVSVENSAVDCKRKKVGVAGFVVTVDGYLNRRTDIFTNGADWNECSNVVGSCGCVHAEPKLILSWAQYYSDKCVILCTHSPCTNCANLIVLSGFVYAVIYRTFTEHDPRGVDIIRRAMPICGLIDIDRGTEDYVRVAAELQTHTKY